MVDNLNSMKYGGYTAKIEYDDDDEIFFGRLVGICDGITFHADNVADLKTAFHEAVDDYVDTCAKMGTTPQKPFSGNLMLRIDPAVQKKPPSPPNSRARASINGARKRSIRRQASVRRLDFRRGLHPHRLHFPQRRLRACSLRKRGGLTSALL
jgi:predicted HicB family RNase H-like nuclease